MALRLQGLASIARLRSRRLLTLFQTISPIPLSSDSQSYDCKRGMSGASSSGAGAAAWEESVELETDHSLARRVEQAINEYRVRKAAPDWLPFLPGSSYWIPPEPQPLSGNGEGISVVKLELSEDELLALLAPCGWPSSSVSDRDSSAEKKRKNKSKKKA